MPWADQEKNRQAVRDWRRRNPGYWRDGEPPLSRYQALDQDIAQQRELYRLSHRKDEHPDAYRQRERQWITATFWIGDGSREADRRAQRADEA